MDIRRVAADEVGVLREGLAALAQYHNAIPSIFSGVYPAIPVEETLEEIARQLSEDRARAEVVYEEDRPVGFCKVSVSRTLGVIDYLFVHEECRGKGYGECLLERALTYLRERGVDLIDLRVVIGNSAQAFYEKHGFQARSLIMSRKP